MVVDFRPQKENPNRVRITAGGNLIKYAGELTTRTANLTTAKLLWNRVISTDGAKFMGFDIGYFYLETHMEEYEYMLMLLHFFPQHTIDQYKLQENTQNGQVYLELRRAIYMLPKAGALANKQLKKFLAPYGYYEVAHTPGLWRFTTRPIKFSLVVDDLGVKYIGKQHVEHLVHCLKKNYAKVSKYWDSKLYCGITLEWSYSERWVDISMPGYTKRLRQRYEHI